MCVWGGGGGLYWIEITGNRVSKIMLRFWPDSEIIALSISFRSVDCGGDINIARLRR